MSFEFIKKLATPAEIKEEYPLPPAHFAGYAAGFHPILWTKYAALYDLFVQRKYRDGLV